MNILGVLSASEIAEMRRRIDRGRDVPWHVSYRGRSRRASAVFAKRIGGAHQYTIMQHASLTEERAIFCVCVVTAKYNVL